MSDTADRKGNERAVNRRRILLGGTTLAAASVLSAGAPARMAQAQQPVPAQPAGRLPNVLAIMADDIGWFNVSAYHRGMMGGRTPNIDRIAREGVLLTDAYGQASRTAGRAARPDVRRPHPCRPAQAAGLHDGPDREEPSGRPQRVLAYGSRLRR